MTFDPTKPVQTRNGCAARIITSNRKCERFPIVALVEDDGDELIHIYTANGKEGVSEVDSPLDLVNIDDGVYRWVNVYNNGNSGPALASRELADENAGKFRNRTAVLQIKMVSGRVAGVVVHDV